jgi:hypothetical protein
MNVLTSLCSEAVQDDRFVWHERQPEIVFPLGVVNEKKSVEPQSVQRGCSLGASAGISSRGSGSSGASSSSFSFSRRSRATVRFS